VITQIDHERTLLLSWTSETTKIEKMWCRPADCPDVHEVHQLWMPRCVYRSLT